MNTLSRRSQCAASGYTRRMKTSVEAFQIHDQRPVGAVVIDAESMRAGQNDPGMDWAVGSPDPLPDSKGRGDWYPGEVISVGGVRFAALFYVNERFGPEPMTMRLAIKIDGQWRAVEVGALEPGFFTRWAKANINSLLPLEPFAWRFLPGSKHYEVNAERPAGWSHTADEFLEQIYFKSMMVPEDAKAELRQVAKTGEARRTRLRLLG